jgi:hypothetical protein
MNQLKRWTSRPVGAKRDPVNAISLLLLLCVLTVVMFAALRSPLKDDIAWLLYVARRWLAGRELYVDVIEVNPPLIVWLSAIPLAVARWLDVNPQFIALPAFAAVALVCSWWSACLLRPLGGVFAARVPVFTVIGIVLLLIPAADLGQREHLLVAAFLPYLILFARSLQGPRPRSTEGSDQPSEPNATAVPAANPVAPQVWLRAVLPTLLSRAELLGVGALAALGCALKPQYGLVFAALELVALRRGMRPWRPMPMAAAAVLAGYFGLIAYVCPAYLRHAVPMALALYGATDVTFVALLVDSASLLAAEAFVLFLWWRDRRRMPHAALMMTGIVFAAVSTLICFIDGKDWFYHRLPATVMTVLMLILWAATKIKFRANDRAAWRGLAVAGLVVALFCVSAVRRLEPQVQQAVEPKATTVARLEALIRLHHAHTYVAFSEWIALGFPVVNNTGVVWASRFDSMWALKGELWRAHIDPAAAKEWPIARWVAHDFIAGCPDIAVVDTREGINYIGVLSASDPAFAHAWSRYKQILAFDGLKVFRRAKGGCIEPWVAAQGPGLDTMFR